MEILIFAKGMLEIVSDFIAQHQWRKMIVVFIEHRILTVHSIFFRYKVTTYICKS